LKATSLTLLLGILTLSNCSPTDENQVEIGDDGNSQNYLMAATLFTQQSAEYTALCHQAYHLATMQALALAGQSSKPAIILDLDETVLDNSPYTAWQVIQDRPYSPDTWTLWVLQAQAEAVPGATAFLHVADSLGYTIFYISNRDTSHLKATMQNMADLGLPQVDTSHYLLKTNTSDKTERRDAVRQMGFDILLMVGDNLGDFDGAWDKPANSVQRKTLALAAASKFGVSYIVLPNTLYGTWEGAIMGYNRDLTEATRDSLRKQALQPANL
jgi:5'-nucleotidase (lipoprotein e(P4) family)